MDYFVISLIEELEKIANVNQRLKMQEMQKIKNAVNNSSAKKQLTSKMTPNNKPNVGSASQQNAVQQMEDMKNA